MSESKNSGTNRTSKNQSRNNNSGKQDRADSDSSNNSGSRRKRRRRYRRRKKKNQQGQSDKQSSSNSGSQSRNSSNSDSGSKSRRRRRRRSRSRTSEDTQSQPNRKYEDINEGLPDLKKDVFVYTHVLRPGMRDLPYEYRTDHFSKVSRRLEDFNIDLSPVFPDEEETEDTEEDAVHNGNGAE